MTFEGIGPLIIQSVTAPRDAARYLLSLRLGREALFTMFGLVVVLNTLIFAVSNLLFVQEDGLAIALQTPSVFLALTAVTLAATIVAMTLTGRWLGGTGSYADIGLVFIWMQALRVVAQALIMIILAVSPALGGLAVMVTSALGVWIAVHFIDEAHGLGNMLRSIGVLVLGIIGMAVAVSVLLTMLGVSPEGMPGYV